MKSTHRYKISTKACECVLLGVSIIKFFFENKTFEFVLVFLFNDMVSCCSRWSVAVPLLKDRKFSEFGRRQGGS